MDMVQQPTVWIRFNNLLHGRGSLKQQLGTWTQFNELNANKTDFLIIGTNVEPEFETTSARKLGVTFNNN